MNNDMSNVQLVILMGGNATRLAPLSYSLPKGLLSINQRPAIFNMISAFIKKGLKDITFVTSPTNNKTIKDFCNKAYSRLNIKYVIQENPQGPLHAFAQAEPFITKPTLLLLGDTICSTNFDFSKNFLAYKTINDDSHSRWCLIETDSNEKVTALIDKPEFRPHTDKVLIGVYYFKNYQLLKNLFSKEYPQIRHEYQLSSLIDAYINQEEMVGHLIDYWLDTGTIDDYAETFKKYINGRSFNSFVLDEFGVVEKTSSYEKLKNEIHWLEKIEKTDLSKFIPKFWGAKQDGDKISYKTEFIDNPTLAEYLCFYPIVENNWKYIFEKLLRTAKEFWKNKSHVTLEDAKERTHKMLVEKTLSRIKNWDRADILNQKTINVNGETLVNFKTCFNLLKDDIDKIVDSSKDYFSIIHGDMCFSNILFSPRTATFKLIDPRGSFGTEEACLYGDLRYDLAKFRHCYHGLYDYLIFELFELTEINASTFKYNYLTSNIVDYAFFDDILEAQGYNVDDIELIEGLLFISMIPLHADNKQRQLMQYFTGLKCLNNQLVKRGKK